MAMGWWCAAFALLPACWFGAHAAMMVFELNRHNWDCWDLVYSDQASLLLGPMWWRSSWRAFVGTVMLASLQVARALDNQELISALLPHVAPPPARYTNLNDFLKSRDHFGPGTPTVPVVVVDDFYLDPNATRKHATALPFWPYMHGAWMVSVPPGEEALVFDTGRASGDEFGEPVMLRFERLLNCSVDQATWHSAGDGWNGAFHSKVWSSHPFHGAIHNHVGRNADLIQGWSGLVYLNPEPLAHNHGVSFWGKRRNGGLVSVATALEETYEEPSDVAHELLFHVRPRFNRLVLFWGSMLHRAGEGFGRKPSDARLTQTFFFNVRQPEGRL